MRTSTRLFFIIVLTTFVATACGYRGPLYMPDPVAALNITQVK
jgi:predicted small lipoprotein YifL